MISDGWIKVYRKLQEKSFYKKDSEAVHLWIHILMSATHKPTEETLGGRKIICQPGQFTTGRKQLANSTGINESKIERLLTKFEKIEQQIEQQKSNTNRLITVLNWSEYQIIEQQSNNERTTDEQQLNTLQEEKNKRSKETKEEEKADFLAKIITAFQESYFEIFQTEYTVVAIGKERSAAAKIARIYKQKYPEAKTDEVIAGLKNYFLACCEVPDEWMQKNMSLPIIVSKFNEINSTIKNQKNGRSSKTRSIAERGGEIDAMVDAIFKAKAAEQQQ